MSTIIAVDSVNAAIPTDTEIKTIKTTCAYCGVGCGIEAQVNVHTRGVTINGDFDHPANYGRLCSKGSSLGETLALNSRLLQPAIVEQGKERQVSWSEALDVVSNKFKQVIADHGPAAVAIYGSGQLLTEDYYVANKLMKGFIGSANIDTNSRLCMSSAVTGHKRAFGTDTVATCYEDLDHARLMILIGSNTAWCHPIVYQRIRAAKDRNPELKIVVIDPRRTATCDIADLHLPLASGSDVKLFNGLLHYLNKHNRIDRTFIASAVDGADDALNAAAADAGDINAVADYCQLAVADVQQFYQWFADTQEVVSLYSQDVKQSSSGADKVNAILNCHLLTGRIGKPGCGPLSLTGQPNAMGGREVGGLANQVAAHMEFAIPGDIERVARFWNAPNMVSAPGKPAVELFDAIADGSIKAVWIMATNPVVSLPNADKVKRALAACEFVVVSDCVAESDTLALAHVKLPALGWSEKDGMVTNSERCITHQRALLPPAGEAKPDWWIISQVAQRLGFVDAFNYGHAVDVFREHAALSGYENNVLQRLRDFDISAFADISLADYNNFIPIQWPVNKQYPQGMKRFFTDGKFFTENGRAQAIPLTTRLPGNKPNKRYPLVLNTGRLRDQWHTMTRSALSPRLNQHRPEPFVEIHPSDAAVYNVQQGTIAHLLSQWGQMYARVIVTDAQRPGNVFVPMHWSEQYAKNGRMGALVNPVVDPLSGQPESKHTPVSIRPLPASWYGFVLSRQPIVDMAAEYHVKVNSDRYYRYELAGVNPLLSSASLARDALAPLVDWQWQEFEDTSTGVYRAACYLGEQLQAVICIAPTVAERQLPARGWLGSLFAKPTITESERMSLLAGVPTTGGEDAGETICACFNVGEKTIRQLIVSKGLRTHQAVGACCKAGTNCGSCVPEIKQLLSSCVAVPVKVT